jgi:branched-chain amino acid transport system permease protein
MELFTNQILAGISTGAIYACMALAVVMIYQAIDHLNFAISLCRGRFHETKARRT